MPKINLKASAYTPSYFNPNKAPPERRALGEVLGVESSASKRGSTYYGRLLTCPREFALANVVGLRPLAVAEPLTTGIAYHHALETYYDSIADHQKALRKASKKPLNTKATKEHFFWGASREAQEKAFASIERIRSEPGYELTWQTLERILNFYFETYWKVDEWEVLATEYPVEVNVGAGVTYTTRLDLITHDHKRNGVWVVEEKTARFITDDLLDNYQQEFQILGEVFTFLNTVQVDLPFLGVNVCIVSKGQTPKAVRTGVFPSTAHVREFKKTLLAFSSLREVYKGLGWPKALGHCAGAKRGYSRCQFYNLCHDFPEVEVDDWLNGDPPVGFEFTGVVDQDVG